MASTYRVTYLHPSGALRTATVVAANQDEAAQLGLATMHTAVRMHRRLSSVRKVADMPRSTLTAAASAVHRIYASHHQAAEYDEGFDGGEFSGPAHWEAADREARAALAVLGWTPDEYNDELAARTTAKYAFFSGLEILQDAQGVL